jgi:glutathionyl-hydroquinone reductase
MSIAPAFPAESAADGSFVRQAYSIRDRISANGATGFPAEPGRYHLYVSLACPWAHRAVIVRTLLGLEDVVSLSVVDPVRDERGWAFRDGPGYSHDPVNGFAFLSEAYLITDPSYTGRYTVPCLWDRVTGRLVTNNYPDITIDLETQFTAFHGHFKCNLRRLVDYPNLWGYTRDLYQQPGFGETVDLDQIKRHYYLTHPQINPTRIVPLGPVIDWDAPHQRALLV